MTTGHPRQCNFFSIIFALGASFGISLTPLASHAVEDIGVTAAVKPAVWGKRPEQSQRVLKIGLDMIRNERIMTKPDGRAQILFRDGTTLTVGPNSDIVLDEFVYDDDKSTGTMVVRASKGLLRLVGGKISKKSPIKIKTPTATVGIRGGITVVEIAPDGTTDATFLFGRDMTVDVGGQRQTAVRPNSRIRADRAQIAPTPPVVTTDPKILSGMLQRLEAPLDGPSLVDVVVVEEALRTSSVEQYGSGDGATNLYPGQTAPPPPPPPGTFAGFIEQTEQQTAFTNNISGGGGGTTNISVLGRFRNSIDKNVGGRDGDPLNDEAISSGTIGNGFFTVQLLNNDDGTLPIQPGSFTFAGIDPTGLGDSISGLGFFAPTEQVFFYEFTDDILTNDRTVLFGGTPSTSIPTTGRTQYKIREDYLLDSQHFFTRRNKGGDVGGFDNGRAFITWDGSAPNSHRGFGALSLAIEGQGVGQRSTMVAAAGSIEFDAAGKPFLTGGQFGSARIDNADPFVTFGEFSSVDDINGNDFFGIGPEPTLFAIDSAFVDPNDVIIGRGVTQTLRQIDDPVTFNPFNVLLREPNQTVTFPITTEIIRGFTAGIAELADISGTPFGRQPVASNDMFAASLPDPFGLVIDKNALTNKVNVIFSVDAINAQLSPLNPVDIILPLGDDPLTSGHSAFFDDAHFGAGDNPDRAAQPSFNSGPAGAHAALITVDGPGQFFNAIPAGVNLCTCPFLRWGFWSGEIAELPGDAAYFHLASWVAGTPATDTAIANLNGANVTYSGHVSATVRAGPFGSQNMYNAVGSINMNYTFGATQNGTFTITNLDNTNYNGTVQGFAGDRSRFSGSNDPGPRTVLLQGAFYQGGGLPNAQAGGQITIENPSDYFAVGIFAMDKAP